MVYESFSAEETKALGEKMAQRIGVDVGGTNVKIALVSDEGKIIYSNSIPTRAEMGYEYTVNSMKEAIRELQRQ